MCFPKVPEIDKETKAAQEAAKMAENERKKDLKEKQLDRTKRDMGGVGTRSLISGSKGSGFGRNFFG